MQRQRLNSLCAALMWAAACSGDHAKAPAPPAPPAPPPPAAPVPAAAETAARAAEPASALQPEASRRPAASERARPSKPSKAAGRPNLAAERPSIATKTTPPAPAPAAAASKPPLSSAAKADAAAPAKPGGKVSVPSTAHVRIEVPSALQADLDRDPRMQPWINQVISVIDRCHGESARGGALAGTIEVQVTMHENERPDADIRQLPPQLSPIVACATGGLMRTKMPLFTGAEGARRTLRIVFK
jgi:hypothetical protein